MSYSQPMPSPRPARLQARAGFTLVELVFVLLLVGVLSGLAVPSLSGLTRAKAHIERTRVRSFLIFVQEWAIGTGRSTWVGYDVGTKHLVASQARMNDNQEYVWRVAITDPLSHAPLSVDLSELFREKDPIQDRYGDLFPVLQFNEVGTPSNTEGKPLSGDFIVPLTEGLGVLIHAETGLIGVY